MTRIPFHIINLSNLFSIEKSEDLAVKIAETTILGEYDLILINFDKSNKKDISYESLSNAKMIYEVMNLTGCPVLSLIKNPVKRSFKNILLPINLSVNIFKGFEQILPLIKLFNLNVHLLIINSVSGNEVDRIWKEIYNETRELFMKNSIKVIPRIIIHENQSDTILAYASVIGADLIGNGIQIHDKSGSGLSDSIWLNLINRSEIPLYNFSY